MSDSSQWYCLTHSSWRCKLLSFFEVNNTDASVKLTNAEFNSSLRCHSDSSKDLFVWQIKAVWRILLIIVNDIIMLLCVKRHSASDLKNISIVSICWRYRWHCKCLADMFEYNSEKCRLLTLSAVSSNLFRSFRLNIANWCWSVSCTTHSQYELFF
jgi:hypothetical protein